MKKLVGIISVLLVTLTCAAFAVGCNDSDLKTATDTSGMEYVEDLSAYDFFVELNDRFNEDTNYHRKDYFEFKAGKPVALAKQESLFESYRDGAKYFSRNTKVCTGASKANDIESFYYDGSKYYFASDIDNPDNVTRNKDVKEYDKDDHILVQDFGTFADYNKADGEKRYKADFQHVTTYSHADRTKCLSENHNDKVYVEDKENNILLFTITFNCSLDTMKTTHVDAWKEFERNTGADEGTIEMIDDTYIEFRAQKINGEYRIVKWNRVEHYKGKQLGGVPIECNQQSLCFIEYDNYTITPEIMKTKLA